MKQLNIGIIGAGRIGKVHMQSITYNVPTAKVLGITDVFKDGLQELADKYGFDTFVKERLHNMLQSTKPGEMFEELLIGNYDLLKQAETNQNFLLEQSRQLTLFDFQYDY